MVASTVVCVPGGITYAPIFTSVQPHLVRLSTIRMSSLVVLTTGKAWRICEPRATVPKSYARSGKTDVNQSPSARQADPRAIHSAAEAIQHIKVRCIGFHSK